MTAELEIAPLADGHGLSLAGELDIHTAPLLRASLAEAASMHDLRLDLSQLIFIDSSGLHALMTFAQSRNGRGPLMIDDPSDAILRTLEIVGFHKHPNIEIRHTHGPKTWD